MTRRLALIRVVVVATALLGVNYVAWRWLFSVSWSAWWIAVPLVLAETYSLIDSLLFGMGMWRLRERGEAPPPVPDRTVDVFIATYNEPIELVMETARAAKAITYPHRTWILDDGNRPEMREAAESLGIGWLTRSSDWDGMPRHAKAGNLNNALLATDGEFLLILDADQVPLPEILDHTLGYFEDEKVALVQTPQWFVNVPEHDPLGSQAPLFYGPIQQGKDGWNSAFFCGSNAIIRREALMQLGISRYVGEVEVGVKRALRTSRSVVRAARRQLGADEHEVRGALDEIEADIGRARRELARGVPLFDVTYRFQRRVEGVRTRLVAADLETLQADLAVIAELDGIAHDPDLSLATVDEATLTRLAGREMSPLGAVETVEALVRALDVDRTGEAQPIMPLATISVTEDMATCMRLHTMGWRSVYHDEVLAKGLAPEDLQTMLVQRLRWAQGTVQVMFRENPLVQKGLSIPQRLMYFSTMWSYLSGFAALVYIAAPVIYLTIGVLPVQALSTDFFVRLVPFLVVNQLLFLIVADGRPTWRGQQYSLALFPVWIKSFTSAFGNVFLHRDLDFAVTPKTKQADTGPAWHLVRPQLWAIGLLVVAIVVGAVRIAVGQADPLGSLFNMVWVVFDLAIFSIIIRAARYRGFVPTTTLEGAA
ncbi:Cellulose synthase catalytic subunit [UDP-forming] [Nocardioides dokdonensis FR1436]|uniref:Cellulose synthase catalytic subunit [UDP-forming] n=1 Tax=Nocardioides dokdonensis FR1436 TaxID=1300347 RepID=A0A1A9GNN5_9ACTN|nr:glycosyltransferase family 2 protein [Nocardioides dokdonensis]ANH39919.1 Cellulose synthase catalytic subunit [UDP-forming] [Nocardioides dokdonensis FR1436]